MFRSTTGAALFKRFFILSTLALLALCLAPSANGQALSDAQRSAIQQWLAIDSSQRPDVSTLELPQELDNASAKSVRDVIWQIYGETVKDAELGDLPPTLREQIAQAADGRLRIRTRSLTLGEHTMPYAVIRREAQPIEPGQRSLFICTHGGGAKRDVASAHAWAVNTREFQTQIQFAMRVYEPEGIYFIPRMADDRLGRWWHRHNHDAFERVIEHAIARWGVDPDRVYLLGISEGGYGTAILAPFMPDRFAAANAMAAGVDQSNPPRNLRNLPFRTDVGERDTTFQRAGLAIKFHQTLDELKLADSDPNAYNHDINVQAGRGHGIDYRPGVAWLASYRRNAWPNRLTWLRKTLHDRSRDRHYWIEIDAQTEDDTVNAIDISAQADRQTNTITLDAQQLVIEGDGGNPTHAKRGAVTKRSPLAGAKVRLLLSDQLLDLDRPITLIVNGKPHQARRVARDAGVMLRTMSGYGDPSMSASAEIVVRF